MKDTVEIGRDWNTEWLLRGEFPPRYPLILGETDIILLDPRFACQAEGIHLRVAAPYRLREKGGIPFRGRGMYNGRWRATLEGSLGCRLRSGTGGQESLTRTAHAARLRAYNDELASLLGLVATYLSAGYS